IGWVQVSGNSPTVHYGTTDHGVNYQLYSGSQVPDRSVTDKGMNHNFVRLTGLTPNTAYYFVIRDSDGTSKRFWFKTAPNDPTQRLSLIAGGDSRNNATPRRNANRMVAKLRPHAILFGGDMTDKSTDAEWKEWLDDWQLTTGADGRMIPVIAERGNHDKNPDMVNLFDVPSPEVTYALSMGGSLLRVYTLNSEISTAGNQAAWLKSDLEAHTGTQWKIAQYHRPMRPHVSSKVDRNDIVANWEPLFYQHGVKLVVESDAHCVKSTYPIKASSASGNDNGFVRDQDRGVTYIGEGCWGAPLRTVDNAKSWTRNSDKFNHFTWIFVGQDKIEVRYVKIDNVANVATVNDADIFTPPANLDIWNPSNGPVVTVYPNPGSGTGGTGGGTGNPSGPGDGKITSVIATGNDDVEEEANGLMYLNSTDLELVNDGAAKGNQIVGLRFNGIGIPKGAVIENAYIQFTTDEATTSTTSLSINGEASDNAPAFTTSNNNVSSRSKTVAKTTWNPAGWPTIGESGTGQQTPDLKSIVQEITDRQGWDSLNSMAFIINGTGKRTAFAYEGSSINAAKLVIEYKPSAVTVGIDDDKEEDTENLLFKCYPNPAHDFFNVDLDEQLEGGTVELLDITGKSIQPSISSRTKKRMVINTQNLVPGIYFITIQKEDYKATQRILIK
ncbi:MAG: T9SS type A sorting domain-containing protein, partial [Bacteroidota bacterium]|nr:T9SS type A sorting domain-containing protein [Bacteroidota bacterium]